MMNANGEENRQAQLRYSARLRSAPVDVPREVQSQVVGQTAIGEDASRRPGCCPVVSKLNPQSRVRPSAMIHAEQSRTMRVWADRITVADFADSLP